MHPPGVVGGVLAGRDEVVFVVGLGFEAGCVDVGFREVELEVVLGVEGVELELGLDGEDSLLESVGVSPIRTQPDLAVSAFGQATVFHSTLVLSNSERS